VAITEDTRTLLVAIKDAEGIPFGKQIELAMRKWAVEVKGLVLPTSRGDQTHGAGTTGTTELEASR
jgi:hypothetical protein